MSSPPAGRPLTLLADIGGTNVRFGLCPQGGDPEDVKTFRVGDFPDFERAALAYLEPGQAKPARGAFAVAGPVRDGEADLTNHPWRISTARAREELGLVDALLVNDFAAIAMAVPHLEPDDLEKIGGGAAIAKTPVAILGPGSGLGVSFGMYVGGKWIPLAGEGGHMGLPAADETEDEIVRGLRARFGRASLERALSGPGLVNLYLAAAGAKPGLGPEPSPAKVAAATGDPAARAATRAFSAMLGGAAGDLALTVWALGGVYIAGGVVPNLGAAFDREAFRERFQAKGRFATLLGGIPTYLIVHQAPGLLGLAREAWPP